MCCFTGSSGYWLSLTRYWLASCVWGGRQSHHPNEWRSLLIFYTQLWRLMQIGRLLSQGDYHYMLWIDKRMWLSKLSTDVQRCVCTGCKHMIFLYFWYFWYCSISSGQLWSLCKVNWLFFLPITMHHSLSFSHWSIDWTSWSVWDLIAHLHKSRIIVC